MKSIVAIVIAGLPIVMSIGCSFPATGATATTVPKRATVTDLSVPFTSSEADALVPKGFLGNGAYGRLGIGCTVEVVKTTDRGALVKVVSCPQSGDTNVPSSAIGTLQGWVAKSALDLKP